MKAEKTSVPEFREVQKFNKGWVWVGVAFPGILITGIFGVMMNRQIFNGHPVGNHPMSDQGLIISFVLVILLFCVIAFLFACARLHTVIDKYGVAFRFFPFHLNFRRISWDSMESFHTVKYHPVRDYGGWGIRGNKTSKAYTISGDQGLQIHLKTGQSIIIGTQRNAELNDFLNEIAPAGRLFQ